MEYKSCGEEDYKKAAELLYASGEAVYDYLFQTPYSTAVDFLFYECSTGNGLTGFSNVIGIYDSDGLVGTACINSKKEYNRLITQTLKNAFYYFKIIDFIKILFRLVNISKVMKSPKDKEVYLSNFAVEKSKRGKGIGRGFLLYISERYRKEGFEIVGLDCEVENTGAKRLYLNTDFREIATKSFQSKRNNIGKVSVVKMEKTI